MVTLPRSQPDLTPAGSAQLGRRVSAEAGADAFRSGCRDIVTSQVGVAGVELSGIRIAVALASHRASSLPICSRPGKIVNRIVSTHTRFGPTPRLAQVGRGDPLI